MHFIIDNWLIFLLTYPLWGPLFMLALYCLLVQSERGGIFRVFDLVAVVCYPWNWLMQKTLAPLYFWEPTRKGESTVSMRLARLVHDTGWRGIWARRLSRLLNWLRRAACTYRACEMKKSGHIDVGE